MSLSCYFLKKKNMDITWATFSGYETRKQENKVKQKKKTKSSSDHKAYKVKKAEVFNKNLIHTLIL